MRLAVKAVTDRGLKRDANQDSYACWVPDDPAERDRRGVLLVVADGMGGARGGDVASRRAVDTVLSVYRSAVSPDVLATLTRAVEEANRTVHEESLTNPSLVGMGTTCTAAVVRGTDVFLAHVGDSRAYRVGGDGSIRQLTRDHSLVAHLVEQQTITAEEARVDPRRNLVTRSLGLAPDVEVDAVPLAAGLGRGDTLLLCSDGLHGAVSDENLRRTVAGRDLESACRELVALANRAGGPDNITVVLARFEEDDDMQADEDKAAKGSLRPARSPHEHEREPDGEHEREPDGEHEREPDGEHEREAEPRPGLARHRRRIPVPGWLLLAAAVLVVLVAVAALGVILEGLGPED